eukprot:Pompholyxophrys_sp_v1_NODE_116_length_1862_cov_10.766464.p2 type:complete len:128 gc:universal NODE_116_length_1862_cov_10.766464:151-534(+)
MHVKPEIPSVAASSKAKHSGILIIWSMGALTYSQNVPQKAGTVPKTRSPRQKPENSSTTPAKSKPAIRPSTIDLENESKNVGSLSPISALASTGFNPAAFTRQRTCFERFCGFGFETIVIPSGDLLL